MRSWRYSALIDDKKVIKLHEELGMNNFSSDDDPYEVSNPETILKYLEEEYYS